MAYLAADCKGAALAERSGRDTPEHAMNRVALYLAHSLHAVAVSPASLRGDEVRPPPTTSRRRGFEGAHARGALYSDAKLRVVILGFSRVQKENRKVVSR